MAAELLGWTLANGGGGGRLLQLIWALPALEDATATATAEVELGPGMLLLLLLLGGWCNATTVESIAESGGGDGWHWRAGADSGPNTASVVIGAAAKGVPTMPTPTRPAPAPENEAKGIGEAVTSCEWSTCGCGGAGRLELEGGGLICNGRRESGETANCGSVWLARLADDCVAEAAPAPAAADASVLRCACRPSDRVDG